MADAYGRGDWRAALVGLMEPFTYSWSLSMMDELATVAQWEFTAVNALNFGIYVVTLRIFHGVYRNSRA